MSGILPVLLPPQETPRYDPRKDSARCDTCALGPYSPFLALSNPAVKKRRDTPQRMAMWKPVGDELHPGTVLAIGAYPGPEEEKEGRPMVGQAGGELMQGLASFGVGRQHLSYTNTICCVPAGDDLDFLNFKVTKHNREIKKLADSQGRGDEVSYGNADPTMRLYELPEAACRPRLLKLARNYTDLLVLGSPALKAIVDPDGSIMELRGGPVNVVVLPNGKLEKEGEHPNPHAVHRWRVLPTVNPAFVKRYRRWRPTFVADLARAVRFFQRGDNADPRNGMLSWREPVIVIPKSPAEIYAYLNSGREFQVVDIETLPGPKLDFGEILDLPRDVKMAMDADPDKDGADLSGLIVGGKKKQKKPTGEKKERRAALDTLRAVVDRVGVGDENLVYVIRFISVEDGHHFFPPHQEEEIWRMLRDFFINPRVVKGGWHLNYDIGVTSRGEYTGVRMSPRRDGIYDHHLIDSELPHNLGYVASLFEDAPAWKAAHQATELTTDAERDKYCGIDVAVEARVIKRQIPLVQAYKQEHLVPIDHAKGDICMNLHQIGMGVDEIVRQELDVHFREESKKWLYEAARLCGKEVELDANGQVSWGFNANSGAQVARVLYEEWGYTVYEYTDKGEPSTSSECLIKLFVDSDVDKRGRAFIRAVRKVRSCSKKIGTYIYPARAMNRGGYVWPDGRIRVNWGAHTVPGGRLNCGEPMNLQACPIPMRVMFVPARNCPDCIAAGRSGYHAFVQCDKDQLELRVSTGVTKCSFYLDCFNRGWDPHGLLAEMTYGDVYRNADGYVDPKSGQKPAKKSTADRLRDLIKRVVYSSLYLALLPTVHRIITEAEDKDEELIYAGFTIQQATLIYDGFHQRAPEFRIHGAEVVKEWKRTGVVESAILKRIRACRDAITGEDEINTLVNHEIQAGGRDAVDLELLQLVAKYPMGFAGRNTGLVIDGHDSVIFEVPIEMALDIKKDITQTMTVAYPQLNGVVLTAEADVSVRWAPLTCKVCGGNRDMQMKRFKPPSEKNKYCGPACGQSVLFE